MHDARQTPVAATVESGASVPDLRSKLLRVAWLSVALALLMECLLVMIQVGMLGELQPIVAELVQKISWSFIVCIGLAVGAGVSGGNPIATGLAGFFAAPAAFNIARALHNGTAEFLGQAGSGAASPYLLAISVLRAVQYLCLGMALAWIAMQMWGGLAAHLGAGLATGLVFGGAIFAFSIPAQPSVAVMLSWGVNELVFPVGCALIIFVSDVLGKKLK